LYVLLGPSAYTFYYYFTVFFFIRIRSKTWNLFRRTNSCDIINISTRIDWIWNPRSFRRYHRTQRKV